MDSPWHSVTVRVVGVDGRPIPFDFLRVESRSQHTERGTVLSALAQSTYVEENAGIYKFQYRLKNPAASIWVAIERDGRQSVQLIRPGLHEYYFRFEEKSGEDRQASSGKAVPPELADGMASYRYDADTGFPRADIGIITMKPEEIRAVLKRFVPDGTADGENLRYNLCEFQDKAGRKLTAAIVRSPQGDVSALRTAMELIREVRPRLVVLVGIAGGRPAGEFTLGDVVVASRMINLTVDAANPDGSRRYAASASELHPAVEKVVLNLDGDASSYAGWNSKRSIGMARPTVNLAKRNFKGPADWQSKTRKALAKDFGKNGRNRQPIVIAGPIVSASTLMKDPEVFQKWQDVVRDIMAVDMEIVGVFEACRQYRDLLPTLVVRGISDIVGFSRDEKWTEYACETAAAFAKALLVGGTITFLQKPRAQDPF
jgi:nucleoside phosphorylase